MGDNVIKITGSDIKNMISECVSKVLTEENMSLTSLNTNNQAIRNYLMKNGLWRWYVYRLVKYPNHPEDTYMMLTDSLEYAKSRSETIYETFISEVNFNKFLVPYEEMNKKICKGNLAIGAFPNHDEITKASNCDIFGYILPEEEKNTTVICTWRMMPHVHGLANQLHRFIDKTNKEFLRVDEIGNNELRVFGTNHHSILKADKYLFKNKAETLDVLKFAMQSQISRYEFADLENSLGDKKTYMVFIMLQDFNNCGRGALSTIIEYLKNKYPDCQFMLHFSKLEFSEKWMSSLDFEKVLSKYGEIVIDNDMLTILVIK